MAIPDDDNLISDESEDESSEQDVDESGEESEESNEENEEESQDDNETDKDNEERQGKETEGEEGEEDDGEEDEEVDESLEEDEEDEVITEDQAIAAAKEKYPNIFKEFPDLRKYVYIGRQLSNVFPSVESAEEAADKAEMMDGIAFTLSEGNCVPLLNSLEAASENGAQLQLFADRILGALHKKDKALFARATMPVLANAARLLHRIGMQNKNKDAVAAARIFAKVFFPDGNLPDGKLSAGDEQNPEAESLKKQLQARDQKEHDNFNSSIQEDTNKIVMAEILESLKGKKLTEMQKDTLVEKIISHTKELLKKNPQHMRKMILIQRQAFKNGHSPVVARKLQNEWLASARPLLKVVQARMTARFLGEGGVDKDKKKKVKKPLSSGGTGGRGDDKNKQTKDGKAHTPDWAAMRKAGISDADYLLGKEIAKK